MHVPHTASTASAFILCWYFAATVRNGAVQHDDGDGVMQADQDQGSGTAAVLIGCALAAFMAVGTALVMLHSVDMPMAGIGDIVAFNRPGNMNTARDTMAVHSASAERGKAGCVLDPQVLAQLGGSLVVEGREEGASRTYRVHWAGPRTADGVGDCGTQADLLVGETDLTNLAIVAGGYGIERKTLALSYPAGGVAMGVN
jgi:hypothetical protein